MSEKRAWLLPTLAVYTDTGLKYFLNSRVFDGSSDEDVSVLA